MRAVRFGPGTAPEEIRVLVPPGAGVEEAVRAILAEVRDGGDEAVRRLTARFDRADVAPADLAVPYSELESALGALQPDVLDGLRLAVANVRAVAEAQLGQGAKVDLPEGQRVDVAELPVKRAGAYVPGGRAPYPSTVVMCAITASVAGVDELVVCAPPGPEGGAHPVILAACCLCGVTEVFRMGGAQAIAALAYGTESVRPVDLIVGPGNSYVQEAKRQLFGTVGVDGVYGPSELVVVAAGGGVDPELIALDLMAQAEHGPESLCALISPDGALLREVEAAVAEMSAQRPSVSDAPLALVEESDAAVAVRLADALAPEHVELVGEDAEPLASRISSAGCLYVGRDAGTAFGDYVAGSNHSLPTGGAARFAGGLSVATFRRTMARVSLARGAAARLAPAGAAIARAEGFPVHGESMERRA